MALSIFIDQSQPPSENDLKKSLARVYDIWVELRTFTIENAPKTIEEWKYSGKNYGWGYRLKDNKRVIVYLTPGKWSFMFSMVLGEKAAREALCGKISQPVKSAVESAPVYAEGRGFRIPVTDNQFMEDYKKLILIKITN